MSYESLFMNNASKINEKDMKLSTEKELEHKENEFEIKQEGTTLKVIVNPVITNTIGVVSSSVTAAAEAADYAAGSNNSASDNACNATASARKANAIASKSKYR